MKTKVKQLNIRISEQASAALDALAAQTGMNKTAIIEMALAKLALEMKEAKK